MTTKEVGIAVIELEGPDISAAALRLQKDVL
jgi:hypothetical protein